MGVCRGQTREGDIEMAVKMVKAVEEKARAVARSLSLLFSLLQAGLTPVKESLLQHMLCYSKAAGLLQPPEMVPPKVITSSMMSQTD